MEFRDKQSIYLQIAEYVCDQILLKKWALGDKILSIRDLAVALEVNPNTIQRTYDFLQQQEIIVNKRGIGYFAAEDALDKIVTFRRQRFIEDDLPTFFRTLYLLNINIDDIKPCTNNLYKIILNKKHFSI
ncbi:MAG: GntR family transcriptional regulator [Saprospiraceae bacterium]|nr:GntR family transcriptional regulator [Saprospiraceae bacterium]